MELNAAQKFFEKCFAAVNGNEFFIAAVFVAFVLVWVFLFAVFWPSDSPDGA